MYINFKIFYHHFQNREADPFKVYSLISPISSRKGVSPLITLAQHLLSICPNSASCERLFSTFGLIMTKLRTRLSTEKLIGLAELKLHCRDEHLRSGRHKTIRVRRFGVMAEVAIHDEDNLEDNDAGMISTCEYSTIMTLFRSHINI
jgi:hypothetical protein